MLDRDLFIEKMIPLFEQPEKHFSLMSKFYTSISDKKKIQKKLFQPECFHCLSLT